MTEIDGKKYYDWDEIRSMPLGTKFRLSWWPTGEWMCLQRTPYGGIAFDGTYSYEISGDRQFCFISQDRFELYEESKSEREYVDGPDAIRKLMNGEWKNIACDDADWLENVKWLLVKQNPNEYVGLKEFYLDSKGSFGLDDALAPDFLKLKRWYEYKGES